MIKNIITTIEIISVVVIFIYKIGYFPHGRELVIQSLRHVKNKMTTI
jgi:hypothetical protein